MITVMCLLLVLCLVGMFLRWPFETVYTDRRIVDCELSIDAAISQRERFPWIAQPGDFRWWQRPPRARYEGRGPVWYRERC